MTKDERNGLEAWLAEHAMDYPTFRITADMKDIELHRRRLSESGSPIHAVIDESGGVALWLWESVVTDFRPTYDLATAMDVLETVCKYRGWFWSVDNIGLGGEQYRADIYRKHGSKYPVWHAVGQSNILPLAICLAVKDALE